MVPIYFVYIFVAFTVVMSLAINEANKKHIRGHWYNQINYYSFMFPFVVELGKILILFGTDFSNQPLHKSVILVLDFFFFLPSMGLSRFELNGE